MGPMILWSVVVFFCMYVFIIGVLLTVVFATVFICWFEHFSYMLHWSRVLDLCSYVIM